MKIHMWTHTEETETHTEETETHTEETETHYGGAETRPEETDSVLSVEEDFHY